MEKFLEIKAEIFRRSEVRVFLNLPNPCHDIKRAILICIFITNLLFYQKFICYTSHIYYFKKRNVNTMKICYSNMKKMLTLKFIWFSLNDYILHRKYISEFNMNMLFSFV